RRDLVRGHTVDRERGTARRRTLRRGCHRPLEEAHDRLDPRREGPAARATARRLVPRVPDHVDQPECTIGDRRVRSYRQQGIRPDGFLNTGLVLRSVTGGSLPSPVVLGVSSPTNAAGFDPNAQSYATILIRFLPVGLLTTDFAATVEIDFADANTGVPLPS